MSDVYATVVETVSENSQLPLMLDIHINNEEDLQIWADLFTVSAGVPDLVYPDEKDRKKNFRLTNMMQEARDKIGTFQYLVKQAKEKKNNP